MKYRGIIHFHSKYSYDSMLSIERIVDLALKYELNFICLTDHENIGGSIALYNYIQEKKIPIEVIIGAEYNTSLGDVIALGIQKEIENLTFDNFMKEVKKQGGIVLFPHPYKGHKEVDYIASKVDMIEVFNSRVSDDGNLKAKELAQKFNIPIYYASDAHNQFSFNNSILEFDRKEDFLYSLLSSRIKCIVCKKSFYWEIIYSQIVKSYKKRDMKLFVAQLKSMLKLVLKLKLFKRIF